MMLTFFLGPNLAFNWSKAKVFILSLASPIKRSEFQISKQEGYSKTGASLGTEGNENEDGLALTLLDQDLVAFILYMWFHIGTLSSAYPCKHSRFAERTTSSSKACKTTTKQR